MTFYQCLQTLHSLCDGAGCTCWCHSRVPMPYEPKPRTEGEEFAEIMRLPDPDRAPRFQYQDQAELDQF